MMRDTDNQIAAAWASFAEDCWHGIDEARPDAADQVLKSTIASTPAEAAIKIRAALWTVTPLPWVEALALGAHVPDLGRLMDGADYVVQILWSTILSLERMEARDGR